MMSVEQRVELMNELKQAEPMAPTWMAILTVASRQRKQVVIEYKYLDEMCKTIRNIEPIAWQFGRKGIHVLTQTEDGWRRFAVKNILNVKITPFDYETELQAQL